MYSSSDYLCSANWTWTQPSCNILGSIYIQWMAINFDSAQTIQKATSI